MSGTSQSGSKIDSALDGRLRNEQMNGRMLVSGTDGQDKLLAGIDTEGNVKIKLAQDGFNVLTAADDELIWSSDFNGYKIVETGIATVPALTVDTNGGFSEILGNQVTVDGAQGESSVDVAYDPSFTSPIVLGFLSNETSQQSYRPTMSVDDPVIGNTPWASTINLISQAYLEDTCPLGGNIVAGTQQAPTANGTFYSSFTDGGNAYATDATYATIVTNEVTYEYHDFSGFDFSAIPTNATLRTAYVDIVGHYTTTGGSSALITSNAIRLSDGTSYTDFAGMASPTPADTTMTGQNDLHPNLKDYFEIPTDFVLGSDFAISIGALQIGSIGITTVYIDSVTITIDYYENNIEDTSVVLIKADNSLGASDFATNTPLIGTSNTTSAGFQRIPILYYGGSTELWGETWSPSDVNDANFGVALSYTDTGTGLISEYVKFTGFGFNLPDTVEVTGIEVDTAVCTNAPTVGVGVDTSVTLYNVIIKITYVEDGVVSQWIGESTKTHVFQEAAYVYPPTTMYQSIESKLTKTIKTQAGVLTIKAAFEHAVNGSGLVTIGPYDVRYYILVETAGT